MTPTLAPPPSQATLQKAVQSRCRNILFSLLCGSHAKSAGKPKSDVDILVLVGRLPCARRELFYQDGFLVDLHVHDAETLAFNLNAERREGPVPLLSMVAEGIPFGTTSSIYEDFRKMANSYLAAGPCDPNWVMHRHQFTELLADLSDCDDHEEKRLLAMELYKQIINSHLLSRKIFPCEKRNIVRTIRYRNKALSERLSDAMARLFSHHDSDALIMIATEILNQSGGPLTAGFSFAFPHHFRTPFTPTAQ
ncbi:nucleotidyltransferase domain-containing protein [Rugamonas rubra]|nr:nucleotidyltransferase domain-containing protein [Rugamonas rubra]